MSQSDSVITEHVEPPEQGGQTYVRCELCGQENINGPRQLVHADDCPGKPAGRGLKLEWFLEDGDDEEFVVVEPMSENAWMAVSDDVAVSLDERR